MQLAKLSKLFVLLAVLALVVSTGAQQIRFENFPNTDNLKLNGANGALPHLATWNSLQVLRLTEGQSSSHPVPGGPAVSVWFTIPQPVPQGFTSYFKFVIHNPAICCTPGDGLAFVIQSAPNTDASLCASGAQATAIGAGSGGLGYTGIPNSIAIEFDTKQDAWDPNTNHVAMQSCGKLPNTPVHEPGEYNICGNNNVPNCLYQGNISTAIPPLGVACNNTGCIDGIPVTVVVEYTGTSMTDPHHLYVYVDPLLIPGTHTPVPTATPQINVPGFTIENQIQVTQTALASALVGFTASGNTQTTDLITWEFTPHTPTQITQQIDNSGNGNQFNFGDHLYAVTYPPGGINGTFYMTVNAIPISQQDFYNTRLLNNTLFNNEQCLRYYSTGTGTGADGAPGPNCIYYEVTCQDANHLPVACPNPVINNVEVPIPTLTKYSTPDPVNADNADYIKTPIGTNNWCSIFTSFQQNAVDPTTSGSGNNFSDFVATFKTGPGQDPQCPPPGNLRRLSEKPPAKSVAPSGNSRQEPGPAGGNK